MTQTVQWTVALSISLIALFFTILRYRLKAGIRLRGSSSIHSSISCDDSYVGSVVLENMKDRAITIFAIYLKVGNNYYIEIENFETSPLVLKAFETYHKEYGPIVFYDVSMKRILINDLLKDDKVNKCLVVSTSGGKYEVPSRLPKWNPVAEFFRNHMTAVVRPVRTIYKDQAYGSSALYLIEFESEGGNEEIVPIYLEDYRLKKFRKFQLTKESIESKRALELFIKRMQDEGKIPSLSFKVHDLEKWRKETYELVVRLQNDFTTTNLFDDGIGRSGPDKRPGFVVV